MNLIVLDFETGIAHVHFLSAQFGMDCEKLVEKLGYNLDECQFMITSENVKLHNTIDTESQMK